MTAENLALRTWRFPAAGGKNAAILKEKRNNVGENQPRYIREYRPYQFSKRFGRKVGKSQIWKNKKGGGGGWVKKGGGVVSTLM